MLLTRALPDITEIRHRLSSSCPARRRNKIAKQVSQVVFQPAFHEPWERQIFGLMLGSMNELSLNGDTFRFTIESLPPAEYLGVRYYERWIPVLGTLLVKTGVITEAELERGKPSGGTVKGGWHVG